jgi:predicted Zn-dependent peptidase
MNRRSLLALGAAGAALLGAAAARPLDAQVDRTRPPALGAPPALVVPPARSVRLANGLEVVVVEMREVPVVDVTLLVRAGAERDPRDLPGLATFTAGMLDEGAGRRSALAIAEEAAFLGAQLGTGASVEWATVGLHVPKRQLEAALDLMADVALRPAFADSEVVRQRELRRTAILQLRDQPTAQSPIAFNAIIYGADHPYGTPPQGNEAAAAALESARVRDFYQTYYRPNNAKVLVVGDVSLAEARRLVEARFGSWARGTVPALPGPPRPAEGTRTFYLVDKPGAAQSVIRIGHAGVARTTPDYYALEVMNTILGGSFTSRLNQNLRETKGYTYGAGSGFAYRRLGGPFTATANVVTAKTDSALIEFFRELRGIRDREAPPEEVAKARAYIALGLPAEFETTRGAAAQFRELLENDLPLDYWRTYIARINAVTPADVQRVARQHIHPDGLAVVIVGDRSQIEAGIRALGEGPISVRDLWGQEIR